MSPRAPPDRELEHRQQRACGFQELGASAASTRSEALEGADVVVLGVKPYQILDVVTEIAR